MKKKVKNQNQRKNLKKVNLKKKMKAKINGKKVFQKKIKRRRKMKKTILNLMMKWTRKKKK